jgi:hypothetical protein
MPRGHKLAKKLLDQKAYGLHKWILILLLMPCLSGMPESRDPANNTYITSQHMFSSQKYSHLIITITIHPRIEDCAIAAARFNSWLRW